MSGLADLIITPSPGTLSTNPHPTPRVPHSARDFPAWPCPELRAWLMAGRAGRPCTQARPGRGQWPPRGRPRLGAGDWRIKAPRAPREAR